MRRIRGKVTQPHTNEEVGHLYGKAAARVKWFDTVSNQVGQSNKIVQRFAGSIISARSRAAQTPADQQQNTRATYFTRITDSLGEPNPPRTAAGTSQRRRRFRCRYPLRYLGDRLAEEHTKGTPDPGRK